MRSKNIKKLIIIQGPTASGKTGLAVAVAAYFNTEIISADSRQFYREMSIGTAKPSIIEQNGIRHHLIDSHSINEAVSAAEFAREASLILNDLFEKHEIVVLTGGSGMFIDALIDGIDELPTSSDLRFELIKAHKEKGLDHLLAELLEKDPAYYEKVDRNNPSRIIRAIEVIRLTGKPFSIQRKGEMKKNYFAVSRFIIEHPRDVLYKRIEQRVDEMMASGLLTEVKTLLPFRSHNALQTVGYKELFDYLDDEISLNKAIELIKQHTRNYAKRQITWLKRYDEATIIQFSSEEKMLETIVKGIEN